MKDIYIMGIESSCDETSVAIVKNGREVLSNVINSQINIHEKYGGVVPEIASRSHTEVINAVYKEALEQAKKARMQILDVLEAAIDKPREHVSKYAPKIAKLMIPVDKIREVIGTGGKTINQIIEASNGTTIDISDEGRVLIYHHDQEAIDKARDMIEQIVRVAKVGEIYEGTVNRLESYGAFVELFPGTDGLLHVSKISYDRVNKPSDVLKLGDKVRVLVTEIDEKGRVNVSRKALLEKPENLGTSDADAPKRNSNNNRRRKTNKNSNSTKSE